MLRHTCLLFFGMLLVLVVACDSPTYNIEEFSPRIRSNPNDADISFNRGIACYVSRNLQDSFDALAQAAEQDPADQQTQFFLGLVASELNKNNVAMRSFNRTFAESILNGASREQLAMMARVQGNSDLEIRLLERAIEEGDSHPMMLRLRLGLAYIKTAQLDKAISILRIMIAANPDNAGDYGAFYILGTVYMQQNEWETAVRCFAQQITVNPGYNRIADVYFNLGNSYFQLGDFQNASKNFELTAELMPKNGDVYYNLAISYLREGRREEALRMVDTITELNPDYAAQIIALINGH